MSSAISSLSSTSWVSSLFTKIDTKNQGYIDKSELQTALSQLSSDDSSTSVDTVFSKLDVDSDGKITEQELSDGIQKLAEALDNQYNQSRVGPPPPPASQDEGFTKEDLTSMIEEIGDSDTKRTSLMQSIVENFETADTDGDGKVSHAEAMTYDQSVNGTSSASEAGSMMPPAAPSNVQSSDDSTSYEAADANQDGTVTLDELIAYQNENQVNSNSEEMNVVKIMLQLMEAYGLTSAASSQASTSASLSVIA
ncbi:MAG: hypothetical protein C4516_00235 [Oxalobacter sp.]|nr:MAG: hypothetical protein C4516_00235 [Oxalobacter sp.]